YAADAVAHVTEELDRRAQAWIAAQRQACAQQASSPNLAARRMACLHRRLQAMQSYTDLLMSADAAMLEHVVEGLESLGDPGDCDRASNPALSAEAAGDDVRLELGAELAKIDVYGDLGRFRDAVEVA